MKLATAAIIACSIASPALSTEAWRPTPDYYQGVCDGLRASGKYAAGHVLAVTGKRDNGMSEYFACAPEVAGKNMQRQDVHVLIRVPASDDE